MKRNCRLKNKSGNDAISKLDPEGWRAGFARTGIAEQDRQGNEEGKNIIKREVVEWY